jgi:predicted dehydrogenase
LASGGVASVHVASNPSVGSGYRMEIYGRKGVLVASSGESPNQDGVKLQGAQGSDKLEALEIPARLTNVLEGMPRGAPYNVGQMYYQFGQSIRSGDPCQPDFATAVELHHFIDSIQAASDQGREMAVSGR